MKTALTFFLIVFCLPFLAAQKGIAGLWEGMITEGGLHSTTGHRFELYLEANTKNIEGRSYIYIGKDSIAQRDLRGRLYEDRSVYLEEIVPYGAGEEEEDDIEAAAPAKAFTRKYQFIFRRGLEGASLEGYWQEVTSRPFHEKRQRGRIFLKRKNSGA